MSDLNRALSERWFEELWNRKRPEIIDELACPTLVAEVEGVHGEMSRDDLKSYYQDLFSAFPDLQLVVRGTSLEGDKVVVNWYASGTHVGAGAPDGSSRRKATLRGLTWLEWEDGLLVRGIDRWNRGEVLARLASIHARDLRRAFDLTPREAQVALRMAERRTYKEIARDLGIRLNTARRHGEQVLHKLGVSRKQDVAPRLGLQPVGPLPGDASGE